MVKIMEQLESQEQSKSIETVTKKQEQGKGIGTALKLGVEQKYWNSCEQNRNGAQVLEQSQKNKDRMTVLEQSQIQEQAESMGTVTHTHIKNKKKKNRNRAKVLEQSQNQKWGKSIVFKANSSKPSVKLVNWGKQEYQSYTESESTQPKNCSNKQTPQRHGPKGQSTHEEQEMLLLWQPIVGKERLLAALQYSDWQLRR